MIRLQAAACAAMVLAGTAVAQTRPGSATYQMRLVPQGAASGIVSGGVSTLTSITFVVQARATTAAGTTNYGIHWLSSGVIAAANGTLERGVSSGTNFGRFRGPGFVNNFGAQTAGAGTNSPTGNAAIADILTDSNGRISADGRRIERIFAWRGTSVSAIDADGEPIANPFLETLVTDGSPSVWANLYSVTVSATIGDPSVPTPVSVSVDGFISIAARFVNSSSNWGALILEPTTPISASFSWVTPTPGASAMLVLGGLAAARRRR